MRAGPDEDVPAVNEKPAAVGRAWRSLRMWLPYLVKPLRRGVIIFILLLVIEYLVVPELVGASKDLNLLGRMNVGWLVTGVVMEAVSLFCYAVLTKVLLPRGPKPSLSRLFRIDLSAAAVAHVIPAGTVGTAALGFRLFTNEGISANDAGVMMAAKGLGSTVVLNVLLWLSLVISIPLAGFRPIYGTVAILGTLVLLGVAALVFGVTRGVGRASRVLHTLGDKIPGLSGERLEPVRCRTSVATSECCGGRSPGRRSTGCLTPRRYGVSWRRSVDWSTRSNSSRPTGSPTWRGSCRSRRAALVSSTRSRHCCLSASASLAAWRPWA
jgi:hypothetical protein